MINLVSKQTPSSLSLSPSSYFDLHFAIYPRIFEEKKTMK